MENGFEAYTSNFRNAFHQESQSNLSLYALDMTKMTHLYKYFTMMDTWPSVCRSVLYPMTFDGGMRITTKLRLSQRYLPHQDDIVREEDESLPDVQQSYGMSGPTPKRPRASDMIDQELKRTAEAVKSREREEEKRKQEEEELSLMLDPDLTRELESINSTVLDYRLMFGFVPVRINMTELNRRFPLADVGKSAAAEGEGEDVKRDPLFEIPSFGSGIFALRFDIPRRKPVVVFCDLKEQEQHGQLTECKDVKVFMWPDSEPSMDAKDFRSVIYPAFVRWLHLERARANWERADAENSRPTIFLTRRVDTRRAEDITDEELFANLGIHHDTPEDQRRFRQLRVESDAIRRMEQFAKERIAGSGEGYHVGTGGVMSGSGAMMKRQAAAWENNMVPMGEGMEIMKQQMPVQSSMFEFFQTQYIEEICQCMGVPRSYVEGHGVGTRGVKSDNSHENAFMATSVQRNRTALQQFQQFLYEELFKTRDNEVIAQIFFDLDRGIPLRDVEDLTFGRIRSSTTTTTSKKQQQQKTVSRDHLIQFMKQNCRVDVRFPRDPLPLAYEVEDIIALSDRNIFSPLEEINILRTRYRHPRITDPNHGLVELVRLRRQMLMRREAVEFQMIEGGLEQQGQQTRLQKEQVKGASIQNQQMLLQGGAEEQEGGGGGGGNKKKKLRSALSHLTL